MSSIAIFHINLTFNIIVLWIDLSNSFIITKPEISSKNGASIFISFCSFGFNIVSPFRNNSIDLFKKLKQHSHEFITLSNLKTFLIPKTMSTFSYILDTKVYISNLFTMDIYYYWNDKKYAYILSIAYLDSLRF